MTCGKMVRCWDNTARPCQCRNGHKGGCNPFSPVPGAAALISNKEAQQPAQEAA